MKRDIEKILQAWAKDTRRRPLIVRGARQVGKTYTILRFGEISFRNTVHVNFEQEPRYRGCFGSLKPQDIVDQLSILSGRSIIAGETLLFLDEIQECPEAVKALRYFYEQMPKLAVIAAGSLLELALRREGISVPVGRVQYLYMRPFSFGEFLDATGNPKARLSTGTYWLEPVTMAVHDKLVELLKRYVITGGMPAVVDEYVATGSLTRALRVQSAISQAFRDDFAKYARTAQHKYLEKVFYGAAKSVGRKLIYARIDPDVPSRDLKRALELLSDAGIVERVRSTSGYSPPLGAEAGERHFKTVFVDVGIMQNLGGLTEELLQEENLLQINAGAVAEQFVGQELLAYSDAYQRARLYYWTRRKRGSTAEIDYLIAQGSHVLPVEVKSGKTGRLKSLHLFLDTYHPPFALRVSQAPFRREGAVVSVPLYGLESLRELIWHLLRAAR